MAQKLIFLPTCFISHRLKTVEVVMYCNCSEIVSNNWAFGCPSSLEDSWAVFK